LKFAIPFCPPKIGGNTLYQTMLNIFIAIRPPRPS
jgi:hypothetical protein